jgi:hypothetical protein
MTMRRLAAFVLVLSCARVAVAGDVDRAKIRNYNIAITPVFTLTSAIVQHRVHSFRDVLYQLGFGAAAGASYYQAKRITGSGRATAGWLLTNATASVVENVTSGEHPIGRFGYTVGPFRLRFATPYAREAIARIEMDWSLAETIDLGEALREFHQFGFRNGIIATDRDHDCWPNPDISGALYCGVTYGVFPGVTKHPPSTLHKDPAVLWHHEMIHAEQSQQLDSVEPPVYTFGGDRDGSRPLRVFAFRHVRVGFVQALDIATYQRPYEERWGEVEAYALSERTPVPVLRR